MITGGPHDFAPEFLAQIRAGERAPTYTLHTDPQRPGLGEVVIYRAGLHVYGWRLRPHAETTMPGYVHGESIPVSLEPVIGDDQ